MRMRERSPLLAMDNEHRQGPFQGRKYSYLEETFPVAPTRRVTHGQGQGPGGRQVGDSGSYFSANR